MSYKISAKTLEYIASPPIKIVTPMPVVTDDI